MEKAQKGDLIRIVKPFEYAGDPYEIGDILEVTRRRNVPDGSDVYALFNGVEEIVADCEYVIHRKAGEEDSPSKAEIDVQIGGTWNGFYTEQAQDAVNPQHYKQGRVEVIDIIEDAVEGADPFEAVCQANVLKYALRYRHKNGVEDLRKSIWYTEKLIAYLDAKSTQD